MAILLAGGAFVTARLLATQAKESFREQSRKAAEDAADVVEIAATGEDADAPEKPVDALPEAVGLEASQDEPTLNRNLALSGGSLALTTAGHAIFPPLALLSVPMLVVACSPFFVSAWRSWRDERKLGVAAVDAISTAGPLVTGHFFATSLFATLVYSGAKVLHKTQRQTQGELLDVFADHPRELDVVRDGRVVRVPFEEVTLGDQVRVLAGNAVPVDGVIVDGIGQLDQRSLTGESQPVDKEVGDEVLASTFLTEGRLTVRVERSGADSVAGQIVEIFNRTDDLTTSIASRGQLIVEQGAPPTLAASAVSLPLLGVKSSLAALFASFGYSMRMAAPICALNFMRIASREGILVKDGRALELLGQVDTFLFDKTGTLTEEQPEVARIHPLAPTSEDELLTWVAAAERGQSHPIAHALLDAAEARGLDVPELDEVRVAAGYGLTVSIEGREMLLGSARLLEQAGIRTPDAWREIEARVYAEGGTLIYAALDDRPAGAIELRAVVRPGVAEMLDELHGRGCRLAIISGDHEEPTRHFAEKLGIDDYFAEVLPQDKASVVRELQRRGRQVCFVGDGINDSLALKRADVSVSFAGASTVATDAASIIFMDGTLEKSMRLLDIGDELDTNLDTGAVLAIAPGVFCIGGVFFLGFGLPAAIAVCNLGVVASVGNAMRPVARRLGERASPRAEHPA